eukprot:8748348-Pyramimonas_sp.AAC.2
MVAAIVLDRGGGVSSRWARESLTELSEWFHQPSSPVRKTHQSNKETAKATEPRRQNRISGTSRNPNCYALPVAMPEGAGARELGARGGHHIHGRAAAKLEGLGPRGQ